MIAGPSDVLVLADSRPSPSCAADMLARRSMTLASAVLVCDSEKLAYEVFLELERQLESLPGLKLPGRP